MGGNFFFLCNIEFVLNIRIFDPSGDRSNEETNYKLHKLRDCDFQGNLTLTFV